MDPIGQHNAKKIRAAAYIDGFNIYHAIDDLKQPHLKWVSYRRLVEIVLPQKTHDLVRVTYCTAYYPGNERKRWRHEQMIGAQKCQGVTPVMGHFVCEDKDCKHCAAKWVKRTEKEGDINVAIHLLRDAFLDVFDHVYLLSADSDQAATVRMFRQQFPNKTITSIIPPGRKRSEHIHGLVNGGTIMLTANHLERAVMPPVVFEPGIANVRMPREYARPADWVHPDDRPK